MGHCGDLAELGLAKRSIGKDDSDRGIERRVRGMGDSTGCIRLLFLCPGRILLIRKASHRLHLPQTAEHFRAVIKPSVLRIGACDLPAGLPVINIPESIDRHDRSNHQVFLAENTGAYSGFHGMPLAGILADRGTAPCAVASVQIIASLFFRKPAGFIPHGLVGTYVRIPHRQIKDVHLGDQGYMEIAYPDADSLFLQIAHDAARRIQSKGTAAAQNSCVNAPGCRGRVQNAGLPGGRPAAADVEAGCHSPGILTQKDRDPCSALSVFRLTDPDSRKVGQ